MRKLLSLLLIISLTMPLAGCSYVSELFASWFGDRESTPSLPVEMGDLLDTWADLGLPDLSDLTDLPGISSLPLLDTLPGGIVYRGPMQRKIEAGDSIPGTDIVLVRTTEEGAEFEIDGMRSVRIAGDSLDYDGGWPAMPGTTYSARLRIYQVGDGSVRVAGVHQLGLPDISPTKTDVRLNGDDMKFPYVTNIAAGETILGTTYGYVGQNDRGAELSGIAAGDYPYRKVGDSIQWRGNLRPDVPVEYNIRIIHFDENAMQVGGVVTVRLPNDAGE